MMNTHAMLSPAVKKPVANTTGMLFRKCACEEADFAGNACEECAEKQGVLQRHTTGFAPISGGHNQNWVRAHRHSRQQTPGDLAISQPGDAAEQEAERVADEMVGGSPRVSVAGASANIQSMNGPQTNVDVAPLSVNWALAVPGKPLDANFRNDMEERFGYDFSRVRVHTDPAAEKSARDVNAHAFTVGHDIVFGAGRFVPGTQAGRRLLAHELTHIVQQSGSVQRRSGQSNEKQGTGPTSHRDGASFIQRFVPCEQASLSLESCPPRNEGEVDRSKTEPMTLHGTQWLSDQGSTINGYLVVGFEVGKSAIKKNLGDLPEWKQLVAMLEGSNIQWIIHGLSDCSGSKDLNEGIRRARAEAIYNILPPDARKNVVSREAVPLYECITGNRNEVARTVNRSVLLEQAGRTVDIKPEEESIIEAHLPKFVCGPDVTQQVVDAVALARTIFGGWSERERKDACDGLIDDSVAECSWDIVDLHNNSWINDDFQKLNCATSGEKPGRRCGESVQVGTDCHYAGSVNYVIFGTMFKLCSEEDPHDYFDFSKSNMKALIGLYKGTGISGLGTPAPNYKPSLAWSMAGYEGWPSGGSAPSGDRNNCVPMCPAPYSKRSGGSKPFEIHWYPHSKKEVCEPKSKLTRGKEAISKKLSR
jgi:hypothetical protein